MSIRYLSLAFCGLVLFIPSLQAQPAAGTAAAAPAAATATGTSTAAKKPETKVDPASQAIAEAMIAMNKNDVDGAIAKLTEAIAANPKVSSSYVLRASAYYQKKDYTKAEADFKSALAIEPKNVVIQFNIPEMEFLQKHYDVARTGYATLTSDQQMGDLAAYKVFLCDLLQGHEAQAQKERDAFDTVRRAPSFYFANAAWDLSHKKNDDARGWLVSVTTIFPSSKITYYAMPLKDLGWLPIPANDAPLSQ